MTVSEHLAEYVLSLGYDSFPDEVRALARKHFIDAFACIMLGTSSASVRHVLPLAEPCESGCLFPNSERLRTDAKHCAMLCAMSAHSNDFDDMSANLNGHPSALLASVVFALAQKYRSSGRQMLAAYIAGVEVDAILGQAFSELGYRKGVNTTCYIGIFGAAVAAGLLMGLDAEQLADLLGIAVNEASGFKANFGTLSKDLAIGMTAFKAITAAECAALGVNASRDAFEGGFGLFESICGRVDAQRIHQLIDTHRSDFLEPGLVMKPYPSCRGNHAGIDCITTIVERHGFGLADVEQVICRVDQAAFNTDRYEYPKNPGEAKFSLAFCIARVIGAGRVSIDDFVGDEIADRSPLEFIEKVRVECRPELFELSRFGAEVEVRLKDGSRYIEKECFAKGDPKLPMTQQEIDGKLSACFGRVLSEEKTGLLLALLGRFDELDGPDALIKLLG